MGYVNKYSNNDNLFYLVSHKPPENNLGGGESSRPPFGNHWIETYLLVLDTWQLVKEV